MRRTFSWFTAAAFALTLLFGAVLGGVAVAQTQNHMHNALADLKSAWSQLNVAEHDKGGHRVQAMNLVNQAIEQVNQGIAAGAN